MLSCCCASQINTQHYTKQLSESITHHDIGVVIELFWFIFDETCVLETVFHWLRNGNGFSVSSTKCTAIFSAVVVAVACVNVTITFILYSHLIWNDFKLKTSEMPSFIVAIDASSQQRTTATRTKIFHPHKIESSKYDLSSEASQLRKHFSFGSHSLFLCLFLFSSHSLVSCFSF